MDTEEMPRVRELRVNAPVAVMPQDDGTIVLEIALPDGRPLRLLFTRLAADAMRKALIVAARAQ